MRDEDLIEILYRTLGDEFDLDGTCLLSDRVFAAIEVLESDGPMSPRDLVILGTAIYCRLFGYSPIDGPPISGGGHVLAEIFSAFAYHAVSQAEDALVAAGHLAPDSMPTPEWLKLDGSMTLEPPSHG